MLFVKIKEGWRDKGKGIFYKNFFFLADDWKIHESSQLLVTDLQEEKWNAKDRWQREKMVLCT